MQIGAEWEDRLLRFLDARAQESVFADPRLFPPTKPTPIGPNLGKAKGERGVKHRFGADGATTFEIVDSDGVIQFEVRPAQKHINRRTVRWLNRVLDAIDPPRTPLKIL